MSGYQEIYRGVVNAWECDIMGHMNVQFYTAKMTEAMMHLRSSFGMTPTYVRERQRGFAAVRTLNRYLNEVHAGDIVVVEAAITAVADKTVDLVAEIINAETGALSAVFEITCAQLDMASRRAVPWEEPMRARLQSRITARRDSPRPPSTGRASVLPAGQTPAEPFVTARGGVMPWECDELGHMSARFYVARLADAVGHVKKRMGLGISVCRERQWGSAALEYEMRFLREFQAGDILSVRSGLLEVGNKTFRFGHRMVNDEDGTVHASFEAVGCLLDLRRRAAIALPEEVRARAESQIVAWPPQPGERLAPTGEQVPRAAAS